jgi:hypothetical protein
MIQSQVIRGAAKQNNKKKLGDWGTGLRKAQEIRE